MKSIISHTNSTSRTRLFTDRGKKTLKIKSGELTITRDGVGRSRGERPGSALERRRSEEILDWLVGRT